MLWHCAPKKASRLDLPLREKTGPSVVTQKRHVVMFHELIDKIVFTYFGAIKIVTDVYEGWETASGEAFNALHCGGGRVSLKPEKASQTVAFRS